ncbi:aminotransferase class I/II-fold pyridoxal phosphate-dependent enzyme [Pyxidicoccus parkwayensis]|uniref:Aminotransferase class I/II-fold pyridoxal phosphate-dependent enzyme n=1 Tax=Pyxidicoccus parkwayensis TaxID=2813578 RepID=A0ABX7P258_9BACT|nr:aminotransferase class I/II-fold pyridoxal phosphate-dependent enzyme [Pyxidicoccus parkwaysis]QSQ24451.1 aminotransferase class I/II-fold pyridoxal phosphate-dependent enzyme [Pyxidicoccus parkwaysis]
MDSQHAGIPLVPERSRDISAGSPRLQEVQRQLQSLAHGRCLDMVSRVFHGMPGRKARVSSGLTGSSSDLSPARARLVLHFGSYNYSGLNGHPRVLAAAGAALKRFGTTTSGVRLLNGTCELHVELERSLADFLGVEDCITYSSGYMANVSVLSTVCCEGDAVLSDVLNHRSLADGLRLSGARLLPFQHRDSRSLEAALAELPRSQRKFIVTDGIFSMDGDIADLPDLVRLARAYNAYIVLDDAHATAALGPLGRGTPAHFGLEDEVDLLTGSLSKGLPGIGGFAAGPKATIDLLRFGSCGYIFSASLPPPVIAGLIEALRILREEPERQERLHHNERFLRAGIQGLGLDCMDSASPIIPIRMPSIPTTVEMARLLQDEGIYINPVGYPAVSRNKPRLRLNVSANLEQEDLERCLEALEHCGRRLGVLSRDA